MAKGKGRRQNDDADGEFMMVTDSFNDGDGEFCDNIRRVRHFFSKLGYTIWRKAAMDFQRHCFIS